MPARIAYPEVFNLQLVKTQDMRYGENPHQSAAFYRERQPAAGTLAQWVQLQGKELSFNNIADADAAWECVKTFDEPACVIVKHANPCGVAVGSSAVEAYLKALKTDPTSAYRRHPGAEPPARCRGGGRHQRRQAVRRGGAGAVGHAAAREMLAAKQNLRLLEVPLAAGGNVLDFKRVGGGLLLQGADSKNVTPAN